MNEKTETSETAGKRPTHVAYWVKERENKKDDWRQIGVAWSHSDGKGINISLDLQPLDGRIVLRLNDDKRE
jgi:hypothetical protein